MTRLPFQPSHLVAALAAALPALALAAPGPSSAYRTDAQHSRVEDATSHGINTVNMITCILSAMRPDALVNTGPYAALVDESKCNSESRSSSANAGSDSSGSAGPTYMTALVNSSRTTNDDPMRVRTWIDQVEGDKAMTIFVNTSATAAPSDSNPYGAFRVDYCGQPSGEPCMMQGFLQGASDGITFFEQENQGPGHTSQKALKLTRSGSDSGSGMLSFDEGMDSGTFSFAYNASLFRRSDGTTDECFSRDAADADTGLSVWRYGLYDSDDGSAVTRSSGFPIEFEAGGTTHRGYMGYWGLSLQGDAPALANGSTVSRVQYQDNADPIKTAYTVLRTEGRLTKYTKHSKKLNQIDKLRFNTYIGDASGLFSGAQSNRQYEMYWDDTANGFKVTGVMACNDNGCQTQALSSEQAVAPSYFSAMGGVRAWSQALGGEMFIPLQGVSGPVASSSVDVIYRSQDLVYPADMPSQLHCISNCPTAQTLTAYFANGSMAQSPYTAGSAFHFGPAASLVSYSTSASTGLLMDGTSAAVTFTDADAASARPQYAQGVRSGRLFTDSAAADCGSMAPGQFCENKIEELDVYYQWETGPNQWNQFAALKDGNNQFVAFDAPLSVNYSVPSGAAYGDYAGKSLVLQYGGYGDLWGIPGQCVSRVTNAPVNCQDGNARYVAAFAIPFDETLGRVSTDSRSYLVKWLDREIRFARKSLLTCQNAGLNLPTGLVLPTAANLVSPADSTSAIYLGTRPTVTDAPRVIHGEVKY
ncbi:MAG: hypothetical protein ABI574_05020 [Burkholderiales bacterium]